MCTLHCALENGADLYVNERQEIRYYRARSAAHFYMKSGPTQGLNFITFWGL